VPELGNLRASAVTRVREPASTDRELRSVTIVGHGCHARSADLLGDRAEATLTVLDAELGDLGARSLSR
jgi:hypothetical protein